MGFWTRNIGDDIVADLDRFSDPPPGSFWAKWFGGVVFPLVLCGVGALMVVTQKATLYGGRFSSSTILAKG